MKTATKARKPIARSAALVTLNNGKTVLTLTAGDEMRGYLLTPIPSDFGAGFHLVKGDNGDGSPHEEYDVLLDGRESSCTCPGNTYKGRCKHLDAIQALVNAGKIAAPKHQQAASADGGYYCPECRKHGNGCDCSI